MEEKRQEKKEKRFLAQELEYHPAVKNRKQMFPKKGSASCIVLQRKWNNEKDLKLNYVESQIIEQYRGKNNQLILDNNGKSISVEIDAHWHNPKFVGGSVINQFAFLEEEDIIGEGYCLSQLVIERVEKYWFMADKILKNLDQLTANEEAIEKFYQFAIDKIKPVVTQSVWVVLQEEILLMRNNKISKAQLREELKAWKFKAYYYNLNFFPTSTVAVKSALEAGEIYQTKLRPGKIRKGRDIFSCYQENPFKDIEATIAVEPADDYLIKQLKDFLLN